MLTYLKHYNIHSCAHTCTPFTLELRWPLRPVSNTGRRLLTSWGADGTGGGGSNRHKGGQDEVSSAMDWTEALCISYRTTSRHLEIESLGGCGKCSGLDGLKDKNRVEWWEMSTRRLLHRNQSQSCLESDCCWLRGWGVKVILFQAGCGGQEALWPRIHHGQNTPLKPAWPSTCHHG